MAPQTVSRISVIAATTLSGVCGLSWELVWQHHASLALGISAFGTAITLASLMAGLGIGGALADRWDRAGKFRRAGRVYGTAELVIGIGGVLVPLGIAWLGTVDALLYARAPELAAVARVVGTATVLLVPSVAMGLTVPALVPVALKAGVSPARLYAFNVLGAVIGVVLITFVVLPNTGVHRAELLVAGLNIGLGIWAWTWPQGAATAADGEAFGRVPGHHRAIAFANGFVVFALEVSWFRSLRAALQATTETFAIILAAFLFWLSVGGALSPWLRRRVPQLLAVALPAAGLAILVTTPLFDNFDRWTDGDSASYVGTIRRFAMVLGAAALPVGALGVVFPALLDEQRRAGSVGALYAWNTAGAVLGALTAGFVLLPTLGATHTSWAMGVLMIAASMVLVRGVRQAVGVVVLAAAGLFVAHYYRGGTAQERVQGFMATFDFVGVDWVREGPDSTVWVTLKRRTNTRALIIDGFEATAEGAGTEYMAWMGHLPAMAATKLDRALVICFGTGQTANAVRTHHPKALDIVDVNPNVFRAARWFSTNEGVLSDPAVHPTVMDGRAYLRRTTNRYDVITLEPMPPNFAGTNSLYSKEFYELVRSRLAPAGAVAQWVPFHLIAPDDMRAIVRSFIEVFPHARLWLDPGGTGILVGSPSPWAVRPSATQVPMPFDQLADRYWVTDAGLRDMVNGAGNVTDDNQALAYGSARMRRSATRKKQWSLDLLRQSMDIIRPHRRR